MKATFFTPEQLANVFIVRRQSEDLAKLIAKDFRERVEQYRLVRLPAPAHFRPVKFDVNLGGSIDL